ncbi:MAG TPA: EAL domain-containing protein [Methylibium sp.]|nr:EAL domain-containing protein [Methylibium sp.]
MLQTSPAGRLTLRQRVGLGALLLMLAALGVLVLARDALHRMERSQERAAHAHAVHLAGETVLRAAGEVMLSQGTTPARDALLGAAAGIGRHLDELVAHDAEMARQQVAWPALKRRVDALLAIRLIDATDETSLVNYGALISGMESFLPAAVAAAERADAAAEASLRRAAWLMFTGLVGLTALAAVAGLWMVRTLDRQLGGDPRDAHRISLRIADGELDTPVPVDAAHRHSVMAALEHVRLRLIDRRAIEERVQYLARHDTLSGALNRGSLNEVLALSIQHARGAGDPLAVLYIDLDRFKHVNDTLGHALGDEVIRSTAERIRTLVRRGDHFARLGGDEFAIVAHGLGDRSAVESLAQRIVERLAQPMAVGAQMLHIGASVGVAMFDERVADREDLLHKADLAMYRAKGEGRGRVSIYDEQLDGKLRERLELVRDLQAAIGTEQLFLHYQPIYARDARQLSGYEALLRWRHPLRGMVSPAVFVPLAESSGLIEQLGQWVLHQACREAASWQDQLSVSVNLSVAQLERTDLVDAVAYALDASGLPARRLNLEITESMLMTHREATMRSLDGLSALGVGIVMDDFGTGYSSLAYLWRFRFDKLKIDRSFVTDLTAGSRAHTVVRSIVSLAHSLGVTVTAEGIETRAQLELLRAEGCDELQGYLLGHPGPLPVPTPAPAPSVASPSRKLSLVKTAA